MDFDVVPYEDIIWGERIGGGSFGSVYKGQYLGLDIAIKEIHASTEYNVHKYFEREWRILRECRHPNILLFLGLCKEPTGQGRVFIVSEYVPGGNLRSLIRSTVPFPWRLRLSFATDIARAVAYLHARQCLHRDLKGENILITNDNHIKVGDFGFARITSRNDEELRNMTYCGTDGYMSPEVVMGENFDLPTDVYSLGMIFIELLTRIVVGAKVYSRPAPMFTPDPDAVRRNAQPGCPADFVDLALQCCSFAPEDRPTLLDVLPRLRAIEMMLSDDCEDDVLPSPRPLRREGKRAIPLFEAPNDSEMDAAAEVDDQLIVADEVDEKRACKALAMVDIVIDGSGASRDLVSSPCATLTDTLADTSDDMFLTASSNMSSYDVLVSSDGSASSQVCPSSQALPGQMPCTYPEIEDEDDEESGSVRTIRGVLDCPPTDCPSPDSPREASPPLTEPDNDVVSALAPLSPSPPPIINTSKHRFTLVAGAAGAVSVKRISSSFAASLARAILPRTLALARERCAVCSKRLDPRSGFQCDDCGVFIHAKCSSAAPVRDCSRPIETDIDM